ncbi:MAG: hypothetical protein HUJ24_04665 [Rhodobacteraceae bacterium]|nr:hypothetical protein [Paracoccaceae bacterium]
MVQVLVLDPIHEHWLALLRGRRDIEVVHLSAPTEAEIATGMRDADYLTVIEQQ